MKHSKTSKILALSVSLAAIVGVLVSDKVDAAPSTSYNRSVRDMMARRHNANNARVQQTQSKPFVIRSRAPEAYVQPTSYGTPSAGVSYAPQVAVTSRPNPVSASPAVYNAAAPISFSLASLFDAADKDGSIFPGGPCKNCHKTGPLIDTGPCERCYNGGALFDSGTCERCYNTGGLLDNSPCDRCYNTGGLIDTGPCEKCKEVIEPECPDCLPPKLVNYTFDTRFVPYEEHLDCFDFAPLYLDYVDFNLKGDETSIKNKMGNYRFRIFGCRRFDKEAILNHGRIMEKNMHFADIFEQVTGDSYNIVKMPEDICLQNEPMEMPEYILTAEITDFFMNVCDGYDWEGVKKTDQRTGSSEIKVVWKLSNLSKTKVFEFAIDNFCIVVTITC